MELRWVQSIDEVPRADWNELVGPDDVPFLEWEWLHALEASGSISPRHGWYPVHATVWSGGRLAAAAPFYLKTHSWGEFVFDHVWQDVAARLKSPYFPKLVGVIPATPAEGYRFLIAPGEDEAGLTEAIVDAARRLAEKSKAHGLHFLFTAPEWRGRLESAGHKAWRHQHFTWLNEGYSSFDDYLARFDKNQRRNIRRERDSMRDQDLSLEVIEGQDAGEELFERMFDYYSLTNDKFVPYDARFVNREFFLSLAREHRPRLAFVSARRPGAGHPTALAFLVRKGGRLWGRYWGTESELHDLHFNACYYTPIEWCIAQGIRSFDPGAGSHHKVRRGFRSASNMSYHLFFDQRLQRVYEDNIQTINDYEQEGIDELNAALPFKAGA